MIEAEYFHERCCKVRRIHLLFMRQVAKQLKQLGE